MKKLVAVLAAAVLAGGAIFAGDFYNGDIQLQAGIGFDTGTKTLYYDYSFTQNILYAGVSFNW